MLRRDQNVEIIIIWHYGKGQTIKTAHRLLIFSYLGEGWIHKTGGGIVQGSETILYNTVAVVGYMTLCICQKP
jgi:hypothetical protein